MVKSILTFIISRFSKLDLQSYISTDAEIYDLHNNFNNNREKM